MQKKYIILGLIVIVIVIVGVIFITNNNKNSKQENTNQQSITLVNPNVGSVAGVNLDELANEANQSASLSSQDELNDANIISSNSRTANSLTDSVNLNQ